MKGKTFIAIIFTIFIVAFLSGCVDNPNIQTKLITTDGEQITTVMATPVLAGTLLISCDATISYSGDQVHISGTNKWANIGCINNSINDPSIIQSVGSKI
ncbi:MAG: hypothetical protein OIN87_06880, partial [Candidatus Methanoperedens sp.]|nr:hypothetical protein [Candidatus Methanoperedens sp.]